MSTSPNQARSIGRAAAVLTMVIGFSMILYGVLAQNWALVGTFTVIALAGAVTYPQGSRGTTPQGIASARPGTIGA